MCVMFGEIVGGMGPAGVVEKVLMGCLPEPTGERSTSRQSDPPVEGRRSGAGGMKLKCSHVKTVKEGANYSRRNEPQQRDRESQDGCTSAFRNMTERERNDQGEGMYQNKKRARADLLAVLMIGHSHAKPYSILPLDGRVS